MNNIDRQYKELLQQIIHFGVDKKDRTGTGTKSIFGWQIRHKMSEGFPLLTTKKMAWKTIVTELLWFLRGDTNIKYLVDNGCHIWDGDAYKNYCNYVNEEWGCGAINELFEDNFIVEDSNDGKNISYRCLTQTEFINRIKTDEDFARAWGDLGPIYGKQWRKWGTGEILNYSYNENDTLIGKKVIDQIQHLINELKTNPDSRRLMVSAWNVGELNEMVLPPCHYGFQIYTRELTPKERLAYYPANNAAPTRAISLMWNQRSVDTFLGLPFNIASYALLLEIIAREVGMVPDELIGNLGDVHLYNNHLEQAAEQCMRHPYELPKLIINTEFWQTESGECGVGNLNTNLKGFEITDFQIENYQSHPAIKAPLSN